MIYNIKIVGKRFLKGLISGAVGSMILIVPMATNNWSDFQTWINALMLAGAFGGITGALLALEKFLQEDNSVSDMII